MKFALNGAITVGTLDGANIEIRSAVGPENFFLFGLTAPEAAAVKSAAYAPRERYLCDAVLKESIDLISSGFFSRGDASVFRPLVENLLEADPYLVLADLPLYRECQDDVADAYGDCARWTRMSILNTSRCGPFSSDRTVRQYCDEIWHVEPVPIALLSHEDTIASFLQQGKR
jgi:starch phosphorylase